MKDNEFGKLVRVYRKQRKWTQEDLAERWGYTRSYISQVESGKRKLDRPSQIHRLAEILEIPSERLDAIGRGIPERKIYVDRPSQADDAILQMLVAPGKDMVKLSWLVWFADKHPTIEENLRDLILNLRVFADRLSWGVRETCTTIARLCAPNDGKNCLRPPRLCSSKRAFHRDGRAW